MAKPEKDSPETRLARLILNLRSQGVSDPGVLNAIETTPRELFTPDLFQERAWEDSALPIACGQTISQPFIVGLMTQALGLEKRDRVLEIGTGSGYMAALLSRRAQRVLTLEISPTLADTARANLQRAGIHNVEVRQADGSRDVSVDGPFDVIVLSGSVAQVPSALLSQLKPGGRLAAIVGDEPMMRATFVTRTGEGRYETTEPWDVVVPRLLNFPEPSRFDF